MRLLFLLAAGFNTGLSGAMIPGPLFLFTVSEVLKKDAVTGLKVVFGHILIEGVFVGFLLFGFVNLLRLEHLAKLISWVGASALIGMGGILLSKAGQLRLSQQEKVTFAYGAVLGGAFFSIVSPGFLIWWATLGGPLLLQALPFGKVGVISLMLAHWASDIVWYGFVSYSVRRGKQYLSDRSYQNIMRFLALVLIGMGITFLPISKLPGLQAAENDPSALPVIGQLERMGLTVALLIPSDNISAPPHWSQDGRSIAVKQGEKWFSIDLEKVRLDRGEWRNGLPIAVNIAKESVSPISEEKSEFYESISSQKDRVTGSKTGVTFLLQDSNLSTELRIEGKDGSQRTIWSTPKETSHSLELSPGEEMVVFIAEYTGLLLVKP